MQIKLENSNVGIGSCNNSEKYWANLDDRDMNITMRRLQIQSTMRDKLIGVVYNCQRDVIFALPGVDQQPPVFGAH